MIKLRDHYFIAWLKVVKDFEVIFAEGSVFVDMSPQDYTLTLIEYDQTLKPLLKEIRKTVKELAQYTSNFTKSKQR